MYSHVVPAPVCSRSLRIQNLGCGALSDFGVQATEAWYVVVVSVRVLFSSISIFP